MPELFGAEDKPEDVVGFWAYLTSGIVSRTSEKRVFGYAGVMVCAGGWQKSGINVTEIMQEANGDIFIRLLEYNRESEPTCVT